MIFNHWKQCSLYILKHIFNHWKQCSLYILKHCDGESVDIKNLLFITKKEEKRSRMRVAFGNTASNDT